MGKSETNYFVSNKELWNAKTDIHKESAFYDVSGFLKGKNTLNSIELEALGDVRGKSMLHLQCHFGLDTLSWARLGADVTGADFSDKAIAAARTLNEQSGQQAKFVCANIYDLPDVLDEKYDIVFTSYGTIGWLPDLNRWAKVIRHFLKPGGIFLLVEFHPVVWMFDDNFQQIKYSYFNKGVIETSQDGTYADRQADIHHKEYGWNHPLGDVFAALTTHGLQVQSFDEFDYSPYDCFSDMVEVATGQFQIKSLQGKLPMVYALQAVHY